MIDPRAWNWNWLGPLLIVAAYAALAYYFYPWLVLQSRRRLRHAIDIWRDLLAYAMRWPLLIMLLLTGVVLTTEGLPLTVHVRHLFHMAEKTALTVVMVLLLQHAVVAAYRFSAEESWLRLTVLRKLILIALYVVAILTVMDTLHFPIQSILVSLGVGSLAVGLALKDVLANFFAGLQLAMAHPLEPGQVITLENGPTAEVLWINWMNTNLRAADGSLLQVPNARLLGSVIQNISLSQPQATVAVVLSIDRAADLEHARRVALETARTMQAAAGEVAAAPAAQYGKLTAAAAELTIVLSGRDAAALKEMKSAYLIAVNTALTQAGINLA